MVALKRIFVAVVVVLLLSGFSGAGVVDVPQLPLTTMTGEIRPAWENSPATSIPTTGAKPTATLRPTYPPDKYREIPAVSPLSVVDIIILVGFCDPFLWIAGIGAAILSSRQLHLAGFAALAGIAHEAVLTSTQITHTFSVAEALAAALVAFVLASTAFAVKKVFRG